MKIGLIPNFHSFVFKIGTNPNPATNAQHKVSLHSCSCHGEHTNQEIGPNYVFTIFEGKVTSKIRMQYHQCRCRHCTR